MKETTVSSGSKGTLFFSRQRNKGNASLAARGKTSKWRTKTRMTGSGKKRATSRVLARTRANTLSIAERTSAALDRFISTALALIAPGGSGSTAKDSITAPARFQRAAAIYPGAISQAIRGWGATSNHWAKRRTTALR